MPCAPRDPPALDAQHAPARRARGHLDPHGVPSSVGTATVAPSAASANVTGRSTVRLSPSRPKTGMPLDRHREDEVALRRPGVALATLAAQPDLLPVLDPGGDLGRDPPALGGGQGDGRPLDGVPEAQRRAGLDVGAGPRPARRAEARRTGRHRAPAPGHRHPWPPRRTSARGGRRGRAARPRRHRARRSRTAPAGRRRRRRRRRRRPRSRRHHPGPPARNRAPPWAIWRIASYSSRCLGSASTAWASPMSLKRCSAAVSPAFWSGWCLRASLR